MKNTNLYLTDFEARRAAKELEFEMAAAGTPCRVVLRSWDGDFEYVADSAAGLDAWGEFAAYIVERGSETIGVYAYDRTVEELVLNGVVYFADEGLEPYRVEGDFLPRVVEAWCLSSKHVRRNEYLEDDCRLLQLPNDGAAAIWECDGFIIALESDIKVDWEWYRCALLKTEIQCWDAVATWNGDPFCVEDTDSLRDVAEFILREDVLRNVLTPESADAEEWAVVCRRLELAPADCRRICQYYSGITTLTICYKEDYR